MKRLSKNVKNWTAKEKENEEKEKIQLERKREIESEGVAKYIEKDSKMEENQPLTGVRRTKEEREKTEDIQNIDFLNLLL